ncbi:MAG: dihydrofolate reductase family protein [Bacteroidota bacterium]
MNSVFIATSLDGYIADKSGSIDWLQSVPNPESDDFGYNSFISRIDAIVMGRVTYESVLGFQGDWPYNLPVFVLSNSLKALPEAHFGKVQLLSGDLHHIIKEIHGQGYTRLYIDGGKTIQSFLEEDLIDELIITTIPILLGGGFALFGPLDHRVKFTHKHCIRYSDTVVQNFYLKGQ